MEINYRAIGNRIRALRISRDLSQAKLAEKAKIEPSNLSHIERAATKLSLPTLINIANALNVSLDEIVYESLIKNAHITSKTIDELLQDCDADEILAIIEIIKTTKRILRTHS